MAQKKKPTTVDPVRAKAAKMRLAQERADRRTRIIVISSVAAIVLAVVGAVGGVIWKQQADINAARNVDASTILGVFADGRPIIVNGNGVSAQADPNLPTLTEYFDYSCHACADLDAYIGNDLTTWASQGHYNLELQPVITVDMEYLKPATGASLVVAQKAPDKWIEFHHALMAYFRSQFNAQNPAVINNLDSSWKQVKQIATEVGVPSDVIATFPVNAVDSYLQASSTAWKEASVDGRDPNKLGTPELVKDHSTLISRSGDLAALRSTIMELYGFSESASPEAGTPVTPEVTEPSQSGDAQSQSEGTTTSSN
ncbi:DsbA family protein [Actinomyces bouchesdurhonensis]|uniref:DsbA family protein n=1 Tax=Actinomyces bouchesdurhonensis TaxID=1852361 RepID=UPI00093DD9F3|nr:DsbA family protein [Actinomyces bouchesdurhonensis]